MWATAAPAVSASFLASLVEMVEAFTIVFAVGSVRGWKPALSGSLAALLLLAALIAILGPGLGHIPLKVLQLVIGVLLLLFGLRWLRKAILRTAGLLALHDEASAFAKEDSRLRAAVARDEKQLDWIAGLAAFKAVTLEGIEVVFIVIAVGAGRGLVGWAALGAFGAFLLVLAVGLAVRGPLTRVPENALKFVVGIMLSAFGIFWTGEGLSVAWPGGEAMIPLLALLFLVTGLGAAGLLRARERKAAS
jgi:uncharacterized membrane protein